MSRLVPALALCAAPAFGQAPLLHPAPQPGDHFGWDVDVAGGVAVVGAPYYDLPNLADTGQVVVYRRGAAGQWSVEALLASPTPGPDDQFGWAVATDGASVAIGAPRAANSMTPASGTRGRVFVFVYDGSGWVFEQALTGSDPAPSEWFGQALAVDGERLVAGSLWAWNASHVYTGAAYAFRLLGGSWNEEAKLVGADCVANDKIGAAVALSGPLVLAGAPYKPQAGSSGWDGAAYVFNLDVPGGVEEAKLLPGLATPNSTPQFGWDVALHGERAWVGGPFAQGGAVYEYERAGGVWPQRAELRAADTYQLGLAVDQGREEWAVASVAAGVRLFRRCRGHWGEVARFASPSGSLYHFGRELAWDGDDLVVGSYDEQVAWVFDLSSLTAPGQDCRALGTVLCTGEVGDPLGPCPCGNDVPAGSGTGCASSLGYGARLGAIGTASPGGNGLYAFATGLPPGELGLLLAVPGNAPAPVPLGHGLACLPAGPLHLRAVAAADGAGVVTWDQPLAAGSGWWFDYDYVFQVWYRDSNGGSCGARSGATNALLVQLGW